ncbi:MAG: SHOCT domain-containing protein [Clostridia bacterium]|nr:SHOCT domain-containing protein [Clostridia bacterium]
MQAQPPAQTDVADEIKKYKELLDSGIITPEEFESAKAKLLNKI